LDIHPLDEHRNEAYENAILFKEKVKMLYDKNIKNDNSKKEIKFVVHISFEVVWRES
jgi:hypothetical protein